MDPINISAITDIKNNLPFTEREFLSPILAIYHREDSMILADNYYKWYYAIAKYLQPQRIAEIGTFLGYSAFTMLNAAPGATFHAFDNQSYLYNSFDYAKDHLQAYDFNTHFGDTQKINSLNLTNIDLFHIDGDHTYKGCLHDLNLAKECMNVGGIILVDDIIHEKGSVKPAADYFCKENNLQVHFINHHRGLYIVQIPGP